MLEKYAGLTWSQVPFVCIDTETTGVRTADRICSVAVAYTNDLGKVASRTWYVNPETPFAKEATAIHGIDYERIKNAPPFHEIRAELLDYLSRGPWVAHQMDFDTRMLKKEIPEDMWPRGIPTLCTLRYSRVIHPATNKGRSGRKLADVAKLFGIDYDDSVLHTAGGDARLLVKIVSAMCGSMPVGQAYTKLSEEW